MEDDSKLDTARQKKPRHFVGDVHGWHAYARAANPGTPGVKMKRQCIGGWHIYCMCNVYTYLLTRSRSITTVLVSCPAEDVVLGSPHIVDFPSLELFRTKGIAE